jgi:pimeloyl-ACP methyl ester carboxylesterase
MYPAGVPGVSVRYVTLDDGLSLRVVQSGPAKDDAPAVVLVHGWSGCVYTFAEMIPALAAAGYRVIAFDLPGHGLSDEPSDESRYTTRALSDTVLSVANAMSVRQFAFVGHSLGGSLGLDLATRGERRLERLALINSVGLGYAPLVLPIKLFSPSIVNRIVPVVLTRRTVDLVLRMAFATSERPTERDIDEYWAPTQFDEFARACRACLHRVTWGRTPASKLRSLRVPVLVITGGRDLLVHGAVDRAVLIPNARIVAIREGGHLVLQECASQTNAALLQFLKADR